MDAINELKSTSIWKRLLHLDPNYANRCIAFVEHLAPILHSIQTHFPSYTNHSANHSYNILQRYPQILAESCFQDGSENELTKKELYLLICSAYGHDLGMTVFPNEKIQLLQELEIEDVAGWETNPTLQQYLRREHSVRGIKYLSENINALRIPESLLNFLDYLMRAHNMYTDELKSDVLKLNSTDSKTFSLPQLASILCIADAIEFSDSRVIDKVLQWLKEKAVNTAHRISLAENLKHNSIGDNLAIDDKGNIVVSGTFSDADVLHLANKTFEDISTWIRDYIEIDSIISKPRIILTGIIKTDFVIPNADFERLGVRMKAENVIRLISSPSVWSGNQAVVIRELVQNSVEACRYRKHHSSPADNYFPSIEVRLLPESKTIEVIDNGCGMTKNIVLDNLLTIGNSRCLSPNYPSYNYTPIAKFGIGFWSCFRIATHVTVETREYLTTQQNGLQFDVSIDGLKDYILFKKKSIQIGTKITLHLAQIGDMFDISQKLSNEILCPEIPVNVSFGHTNYQLPISTTYYTREELFGIRLWDADGMGLSVHEYQQNDENFDFKVQFIFRKVCNTISFLEDFINPLNSWMAILEKHSIAVAGFRANLMDIPYSIFSAHIAAYSANIKSTKGLIFDLNRSNLLPSEAKELFENSLSTFLHAAYHNLLESHGVLDKESVCRLNIESKTRIQEEYKTNPFQMHSAINLFPDLFVFKVWKIDSGSNFKTAEQQFMTFNELTKSNCNIISYAPFQVLNSQLYIDKTNNEFIYSLINQTPEFQGWYYIESSREAEMLFNWSDKSSISKKELAGNSGYIVKVLLIGMHSSTISPANIYSKTLGEVRDKWSGSIEIKSIVNANFAFPYNRLVISPDTSLANRMIELFEIGNLTGASDLAFLLSQYEVGYFDPSIAEYVGRDLRSQRGPVGRI